MNAILLEYAVSNTLLALPIALIAWWIGRTQRHPSVAHVLWALVLVRLLLPPIAPAPWLSLRIPTASLLPIASPSASTIDSFRMPTRRDPISGVRMTVDPSIDSRVDDSVLTNPSSRISSVETNTPRPWGEYAPPTGSLSFMIGLVLIWIGGSLGLLMLSTWRILRFRYFLQAATVPTSLELQNLATHVASDLGKPIRAEILLTRASLPPFVWWLGRSPQVVLPQRILEDLSQVEQRLVIAHELAHVLRRDHILRWLEWGAFTWLWWNPLVWIARRELRTNEELACDAFVMRKLNPEPRDYGSCLLSVAEALLSNRIDTPMIACTMSAGQSLEQRLTLIMSPRWRTRPSIALGAIAITVAVLTLLLNIASGENNLQLATEDFSTEQTKLVSGATAPQATAPQATVYYPTVPQQSATTTIDVPAIVAPREVDASLSKRFATLEKTVESVKRLQIGSLGTPIRILRDDAADLVRITAVLRPASDEISETQFASDVEATEILVTRDDEGEVDLKLRLPLFGWKGKNTPSSIDADDGGDGRMQATLTILVPRLESLAVDSIAGDLFVEGDVGALRLNTVSGDIKVCDAVESVELNTLSGDLSLSLARQWRGKIAADTTFGRVDLEGITDIRKWKRSRNQYAGVIGNRGSALADLKTLSGSIEVQRR